MVNEITPDGTVVHLTDDSIPKPKYKETLTDGVGETLPTVEQELKSESHVNTTTVSLFPRASLLETLQKLDGI